MRFQHAAMITSPYNVTYAEKAIPEPRNGYALVKVLASGICGSDLSRIASGDQKIKNLVIGHECIGIIESIHCSCPPHDLQVGDRVVVVPIIPCFSCKWCQLGEYAHCEKYSFMGSREDGALAEFMSVPLLNLVKISDKVNDETATFVEPLSVAIHAVSQLGRTVRSFGVVIGAGTIGLLSLQLLKLFGVEKVAIFDIVPEKLEIAKQLGADYTLNSNDSEGIAEMMSAMSTYDHSVVLESSDSSSGKHMAIDLSLPKGEIVFIGSLSTTWNIDNMEFQKILRKELKLTGSWMNYGSPFPGKEWGLALRLLEERKIKTELLITHRFSLTEINKAVKTLFDKNEFNIKMLIIPEGASI